MKTPLVAVLTIFFIFQLLGQQLTVDNQTMLLLHMDGNVNGEQGEAPTQNTGINFSAGKINQAGNFTNNSELRFSNSNNITNTEGTIEAWVNLSSDANDGLQRTIFSWGISGGMLMTKDGADNLRLIINRFGSAPVGGEMGVGAGIGNWNAGDWHHVACSWSASKLKLYIDGIKVGESNMNFTPPSISNTDFYLGSDSGNAPWNGQIDELRISSIQRTDDEIKISAGIDLGSITANKNNFVQQKNLVIVLKDHAGGTITDDLSDFQAIGDEVTEFYWKHSKHSLLLDWTYRVVSRNTDVFAGNNQNVDLNLADQLLRNEGFTDDQFDAVVMILPSGGNFAYGVNKVLNSAGFCHYSWNTNFEDNRWVFVHEFNHVIDAMMGNSGIPEYSHNHPADARSLGEFLPPSGPDFDLNAQLMQVISKIQWVAIAEIGAWGTKRSFLDSDGDGFANADNRLPIDEARFGSNPNAQNQDGDQLDDLEEHIAGIFGSTNPNSPDTDGDGIIDGIDLQPLYNFPASIPFQGTAQGSTNLNNYAFFGSHNGTNFYANNNQFLLHLAIDQIPFTGGYEIHLDLKNDGLFYSNDNLILLIDNGNVQEIRLRDAAINPAVDYVETILNPNPITFNSSANNQTVFLSIPVSSDYGFSIVDGNSVGIRLNQGRSYTFENDDYLAFELGTANQCGQAFSTCETFESGLGNFIQGDNDNIDWTRKTGGTSSSSTGPISAFDGSYYMYVEASGANSPSKTARLQTSCINLINNDESNLNFKYHMYGSTMGSLGVNVITANGQSTQVFSKSGNQGNNWLDANVNLSSFLNQDITIEFLGTTGSSYTSDIAIDLICFNGGCSPGDVCNDFDECTINDIVQTDCSCAGTQTNVNGSSIFTDVTIVQNRNPNGCMAVNSITINYPTNAPFNEFQYSLNGGQSYPYTATTNLGNINIPVTPTTTINLYASLPNGDCETAINSFVIDSTPDSDSDGICDATDPCPNDPTNNCGNGACNTYDVTDFEGGNLGIWRDGGTNAVLLNSANYANSGTYSFYIRGNTSTSVLLTPEISYQGVSSLELNFHFYAFSMEAGDKFHVEIAHDLIAWTTVKTYTSGAEFTNGSRNDETLLISGFDLSNDVKLRFRAETSSTADYIILDDIELKTCSSDVCIDNDNDSVCANQDPNDNDPCIPNSCSGPTCLTTDAGFTTSCQHNESFETNFGLWNNSDGDNLDWTRRTNATPSSSTGPSSAFNGSQYVYIESSTNNVGYPNKSAILESPCFDLPSGPLFVGLYFYYHMFGVNMGSLQVEITTDDQSWESLWYISGNQGNNWNYNSIDLSNYAGQTVKIRFVGITGNSYRSDIAIDRISLLCDNDFVIVQNRSLQKESENNAEKNLILFPNPVVDNLKLNYHSSSNEDLEIQITNAFGQIISKEKRKKSNRLYEESITVLNYDHGLYFVRITQKGKSLTKKFIIQRL